MKKFLLPLLMIIVLSGCKKTDPEPTSNPVIPKYFAVSTYSEFAGHISTYEKGIVVPKAFNVSQSPLPDRIADITLSGDIIYAVRATSSNVDVINAGSMVLVKTISFSKVSSGNYFKQIEFVNNKIVVADLAFMPWSNFDVMSYIKVIDAATGQTDSIPMTKSRGIRGMGVSGNKLYLALATESLKPFIRVLDATNFSLIKDIDMSIPQVNCRGFEFDKDGNVIVIGFGNIAIISGTDHTILKTKSIGVYPINFINDEIYSNSRSYCLDKDNNILYFLGPAAQPATAAYVFRSYDIANDAVRTLGTSFINASSIAYDASQKLVLMGDYPAGTSEGGAVKMYNTSGSLSIQFAVPSLPSEILVK